MSVNVVIKSVFDDKGIKNAEKAFGQVGSKISKLAGTIGVALGGAAIVNFGTNALKAAESADVANNRLDAIAQSMGLFGTETEAVTNRLKAFADQQMLQIGADDELIKTTQAKLLTFKELAATADQTGGAFDRATVAAFDLAAAGFGSAETNAIQLGKALQDPIKGITALRRAGVTFTESEREKIKVLVESGKTLEAQNLILSAIEKQVGGTAAATVTSTQKMSIIFGELSEQIGMALLPAAESASKVLQAELVPVIQDLGNYLQSPAGSQAVTNFANGIAALTQNLIDSAKWIAENWDWISKYGTAILITVGTLSALKTALELARVAQLVFNSAVLANPYVFGATLIAIGISSIVGVVQGLSNAFGGAKTSTDNAATSVKNLNDVSLDRLDGRLFQLELRARALNAAASGETVIPASPTGMKFPENPRPGQKYTWFNYSGPNGQAVWYEQTWTGTEWTKAKKVTYTPPGSNKPKEDKETGAERFKKVQAVIKKAQDAILAAEQDYERTRFTLTQDAEEARTRLQMDAAKQQADIVKRSISRLTDAFRSATQLSLGDLFDKTTTTEIETSVRKLSSTLSLSVSKEVQKTSYSSVDQIVNGIRERLAASRRLLENASKLSGEGFSQTFIEQVLETGAETGNVLAESILTASPETKSQLKTLFGELETVSETGMDAIAKQIYDKFGLATRALKEESAIVQKELDDALIAEQARLTKALADAAYQFGVSIRDIKKTFQEDLKDFDGWFGGLKGTIDDLLLKMKQLQGQATTDVKTQITASNSGTILADAKIIEDVSIKNIKNAGGLVVDSVEDIAGTIAYLQARIEAGNRYVQNIGAKTQLGIEAAGRVSGFEKELANLQGRAATGTAAGTIVNINVKTDTTQSQAMVGKTIGKIVTKYVTTGGQVLVSGAN